MDDSKFTSISEFLFSGRPSFAMCNVIEARIRRDNMGFVHSLSSVLGYAEKTEAKDSQIIVRLNRLIAFAKAMPCDE